jgi:hypothetical protein
VLIPVDHILVGGAITILKNMKVNGKDYPFILWKIKCSKPPTSIGFDEQTHFGYVSKMLKTIESQ